MATDSAAHEFPPLDLFNIIDARQQAMVTSHEKLVKSLENALGCVHQHYKDNADVAIKKLKFTIIDKKGKELRTSTGSSIGAAAVLALRNLYDPSFANDKIVATGDVTSEGAIGKVMYVSLKALVADRRGLKFLYPLENDEDVQPQIHHDCDIEAVSTVNDLLAQVCIEFI